MSVPNCGGCEYEYADAVYYVKDGYHIATTKDHDFIGKGHLGILIVDDRGNLVCS